jgi:hypothetical protein
MMTFQHCYFSLSSAFWYRFRRRWSTHYRVALMSTVAPPTHLRATPIGGVCVATLLVIAMIIWQGVTAHGAPDPTQPITSPTVAFLDIGVLVFREGLECILVLAAITASMTGSD